MAVAYGETYIDTAHDKLCDLLDALVVTMASGYDPTISYVYRNHSTARLLLNAVSCEFIGAEQPAEAEGWTGNTKERFFLQFTVRVHGAYLPDPIRDARESMRLLNSVINKIHVNHNLGDNYRVYGITDIENGVDYPDSQTFGGQCTVGVVVDIEFTQE